MIIEKAVKDIAQKTGLSVSDVRSTLYQWATPLMEKGIIVRLEIKRWRGTKRISPEELGIDENDRRWLEFKSYMSLGTRHLLTRKTNNTINAVENKARKLLKEYSFETIWGYFVPCTLFAEWQDKDKEIQKEFYELADKIEKEFEDIKSQVLADYRIYCRKIWDDGAVTRSFSDYETYEHYFLKKIENEIITAEEFRNSFEYNTFFYFIPMPSDIESDVIEAKRVQGEQELLEHEKEMRRRLAENMTELREQHLESFLESTVGQIRNSILTIVEDVRNSLRTDADGCLTKGKNRTKLLKMIETVRSLNFYNDDQIQGALDRLQVDLNKDPDVRSEKEVEETLKEIEDLATIDFSDLLYGRFNLLEL